MSGPLVTIGIPTFNRVARLRRAAQSALGQSCADLEIVISDNASGDETESVCAGLSRCDPRVRYFRQTVNIGPVANFEFVRRHGRGRFFMWLSDDDWLDGDYVARCVQTLQADRGCALAAGLARYYEHDRYVKDDVPLNLASESRVRRMLWHYYAVVCCGAFYGLMRREHAQMIPLHKVVGCDWLLVGALAFLGHVRTLDDVHIHRQLTGVSRKYDSNARAVGVSRFQGCHPHLSTAMAGARDILSSPVYAAYGPIRRAGLAAAAFATIYLTRTTPANWLFRVRRKLSAST